MFAARKMFGLEREKDDQSDKVCSICESELSGHIVKCDGVCGHRYHIKCVKMSANLFKAFEEMNNLLFMCDQCKEDSITPIGERLKKLFSMFNIYDEQAKRNDNSLEEIKREMYNLKNLMDKGNSEIKTKIDNASKSESSEKMSYAAKVRADKNSSVVIVKPKKSQQNANETKIDIKNKIDPTNLRINRVRNMPAGCIALECADNNMSEVLRAVAVEKMGVDYEVEIPKLNQPCFKIIDMTDNFNEDELVSKLKSQNNLILGNAEMKVIRTYKSGKRWYGAVIQIDSVSFEKCMSEGRLNVGWERCRVFEDLNINMCYKCCGFNHKAKECKNEKKCKKCAGNHDVRDCASIEDKCANCLNAVEKLKINLDTNHRADDKDCRVYNRKKLVARRKIEYAQ